eukprot:SAG31_NODE_145_length_22612_cov_5.938169_16_plen_65_part_00
MSLTRKDQKFSNLRPYEYGSRAALHRVSVIRYAAPTSTSDTAVDSALVGRFDASHVPKAAAFLI